MGQTPHQGGEALRAAEALRLAALTFRRLSARHVRHLLREHFRAGWSPADVLWALDHLPSGHRHLHTDDVRHPAAWLRHRLAPWTQESQVLPGHRAQLEARKVQHRAEQEMARRERVRAAERSAGVNTPEHAAQARAMLQEALRAARWRPVR
jgi:hypothetical protein